MLTNKLKQENLRKFAITSVIFAELSLIIIASKYICLQKTKKLLKLQKNQITEPHHHKHIPPSSSNNITNLNPNSKVDSSKNNEINKEINDRLPNIQGSIGKKLNFSNLNNYDDLDLHVKTPSDNQLS